MRAFVAMVLAVLLAGPARAQGCNGGYPGGYRYPPQQFGYGQPFGFQPQQFGYGQPFGFAPQQFSYPGPRFDISADVRFLRPRVGFYPSPFDFGGFPRPFDASSYGYVSGAGGRY